MEDGSSINNIIKRKPKCGPCGTPELIKKSFET
jgi:hypothetical protein